MTRDGRNLGWWLSRLIALFGVVGPVVVGVLALSFLVDPFAGFDGEVSFENLSGPEAAERLPDDWPVEIDPSAVRRVSYRSVWTRDTVDTWLRIEGPSQTAGAWAEAAHRDWRRQVSLDRDLHPYYLRKELDGRSYNESAPTWWNPMGDEAQVTGGIEAALSTQFDPAAETLWLYHFAG